MKVFIGADGSYANHVMHHQGYSWNNEPKEDHDEDFYAVLQVERFEPLNKGFLTWWKDLASRRPLVYPMGEKGLKATLKGCEWQGVGIVDGRWRLHKNGAYVTIYPVLTDKECDS